MFTRLQTDYFCRWEADAGSFPDGFIPEMPHFMSEFLSLPAWTSAPALDLVNNPYNLLYTGMIIRLAPYLRPAL